MKLLKHPLMLHSPHTGWYKQKSNRNTEIRGLRRRKQILQFYRDPYQLSKGHEACYVALTTEWGFRNGRIPFPLCPQWVASYWQTVNKSWGWLSAVRGCWIWHCCTTLFIFTWSICLTVWFSFFFFFFSITITSIWLLDQRMLFSINRYCVSQPLSRYTYHICLWFIQFPDTENSFPLSPDVALYEDWQESL